MHAATTMSRIRLAGSGLFHRNNTAYHLQPPRRCVVNRFLDCSSIRSSSSTIGVCNNYTTTTTITTGALSPSSSWFRLDNHHQRRSFYSKDDNRPYSEQKKAAKDERKRMHESRQRRKEGLKSRRDNAPKHPRLSEFNEWFHARRAHDEVAHRHAKRHKKPWITRVAAIVERLPQVLPDKPQWQKEWDDLEAYLIQYGKKWPDKYAPDEYFGNPDPPDQCTEEHLLSLLPRGFVPSPRETEADKSGDVRTLDRKLKTRVFLSVLDDDYLKNYGDNSSNSAEKSWQFPAVTVREEEEETLLEGAKRALKEKLSAKHGLLFYFPSNCPVGVDVHVFGQGRDTNSNAEYYGIKTFFVKIQYDHGETTAEKLESGEYSVDDFAWLDRSEVVDRFALAYSKEKEKRDKSNFYRYLL